MLRRIPVYTYREMMDIYNKRFPISVLAPPDQEFMDAWLWACDNFGEPYDQNDPSNHGNWLRYDDATWSVENEWFRFANEKDAALFKTLFG